jgi:hypothetical protein
MVGADGNEYGPVSLKEIQGWVKQGRLTGASHVQRSDQDAWSTASSFAELGVVDRIAAGPGEVTLDAAETADLEKKIKNGGSWFYWIAVLSLINSIVILSGANWGFVLGLSLTQVIDYGVREFVAKEFGFIAKAVAFVIDLAAAGLFITFGIYARRNHAWAFIAGIVIYGFDTIVTLLTVFTGNWLGIIWHGWALFGLFVGLKAANKWRAIIREQTALQAGAPTAQPEPLRQAA